VADTVAISVLMPVHNGMPYLPETVESVLAQSFRNFELLAIDDGSTDATADYLKALNDPRVKYHRLNKVGLVGALNYGLERATAPLIARIDADDLALPDRLALQVAHLDQNPDCVLLGCDFDEIDPEGRVIGANDFRMTTDAALRWQLLFTTPFLHPGVAFRRAAALQIGGYRKTYDVAEDYDMWVRLSAVGRIASLPDRLMRKRMHPTAVSVVHRERGQTQSSEIAANYAAQIGAGLDPVAVSELYWFYVIGRKPTRCSVRDLIRTARAARAHFLKGDDNPDLATAVRDTEQTLRRRCVAHLRREWFRPLRALGWLRAIKGFDPDRGGLLQGALRFARLKLRGPERAALNPAR
jgi:hypothetical protein